ncbi:hypothetical protein [Azospirillum picis]|uniref:Uncharacterized protein n=1 Tax=Azospirillum picis TaxID=488438 RepID=A0ABU0MR97_9PROT|nr:hypothetical protein [Azospirillum picis]MBP2302401.1 hypothetical protein [Azospirillum picis]MDQ0535980.1 hypothetical protein [Azospirillum picis]
MSTSRSILLLASLLVLPAIGVHAEGQGGLAERRAIAAYSKDVWPPLEKSIQDAAGFAVPVTLDLKSLALPGYADSYANDDYLRKPIIDPLIKALSNVGSDAMGREALKDKLKSITISYDEATAPASNYREGVTFTDGALKLNWRPYANVDDFDPRVKAITDVLEKGL